VVASDNAKDVEEDISVVARAELDRAADLTYAAEASLAAGDLNATAGTLGGVLAVHERLRSLGLGWDGSVAAQQAAVLGMQQQAWSGTRASQAAQNSATTATYAIRNLDPEAMLRSRRRAAGQSLSQVEGLWLTNERLQDRVRGRRVAVVYGRRADGLDRQGAEELAQALEASGADARVAADDEVAGPGDGEAYVLVGGPAANSQVRALPPEHDWYLLNRGGRGAAYVAGDALVVAGAEREDTLAAARLVAALLMQT
jgi:hypothetical protein